MTKHKIFDYTKEFEFFVKKVCSGLEVEFFTLAENCFYVTLFPCQREAINCCLNPKFLNFCWEREGGASFCATIDACFSFLYFNKKIIFVTPNEKQAKEAFEQSKDLLQRKYRPMLILNKEKIIRPIDYSLFCYDSFIHFIPLKQLNLVGKQVDKIIFDNCHSIQSFNNVIVREYKTY